MLEFFVKKMKINKGFTLIELIVVIAILGILAAIAVPRFADIQGNAQLRANQATARTIASAVSMAEAQNSTTTPTKDQINVFLSNVAVDSIAANESAADTASASEKWVVVLKPLSIHYNGSKIDLHAE